jgi:uncharacterized protein (TIGR03435 family)
MIRTGFGTIVFLPLALLAQSAMGPSFEVVSVRPAAPAQTSAGRTSTSGDRVSMTNTTLSNVILHAYGVKFYQVDGPPWILTERYDIIAKAADNTPRDQVPLMLQALLADRFKLKVHRETRELPVYELIVTKESPKLKKIDPSAPAGIPDGGHQRTTMSQLADLITRMVGRPVLDKTNLAGWYDLPLAPSMEGAGGTDKLSLPSIFTNIQESGLKLESRRDPIEMIVIDGGSKTPTEN